jgi:hypothetical protein
LEFQRVPPIVFLMFLRPIMCKGRAITAIFSVNYVLDTAVEAEAKVPDAPMPFTLE